MTGLYVNVDDDDDDDNDYDDDNDDEADDGNNDTYMTGLYADYGMMKLFPSIQTSIQTHWMVMIIVI